MVSAKLRPTERNGEAEMLLWDENLKVTGIKEIFWLEG
jgi:hypothetical protein